MSLRTIQIGNSIPHSWPVDPSATFQSGQIGQLSLNGNTPVVVVSDGTAPLGIIDDVKSKAFTAVSWDEEIRVLANGVPGPGGTIISDADISVPLANPNISSDSFVSIPVDVQLIPRNGIIIFPAGTELNFDMTGGGTPDAIKTVVRYTYQIPNVIGDDSTAGSNRVTIWFTRGIYQTDVFDTAATFPLNGNLFVNENGMLTSKAPTPSHPSVGLVTSPPSALFPWLEFILL